MTWDIYEEGYACTGESGRARYLGSAEGSTFKQACRNFIKEGHPGEIDRSGQASNWGCRWFPTLEEAQRSFG